MAQRLLRLCRTMSADRNELISDRAFWIGLTVYALVLIGAVTAFADPEPNTNLNYSGSVIFAEGTQPKTIGIDGSNVWQRGGALTLVSNWKTEIGSTANGITANAVGAAVISSEGTDSTRGQMSAASGARQSFWGVDSQGITAQQLAFGDQALISGDIAPVPEPATWWAATLAASFVG